MINKKCDWCNKVIEQKQGQLGYSEYCLYHYTKRRDFDSRQCFERWCIKYFNLNNSSEEDLAKIGMFILELQSKNKGEAGV